jgi:hypothetical protein
MHLVAHLHFLPTQKPKKNAKELPSQRTKDTANNGQQSNNRQTTSL